MGVLKSHPLNDMNRERIKEEMGEKEVECETSEGAAPILKSVKSRRVESNVRLITYKTHNLTIFVNANSNSIRAKSTIR